MKELVTQSQAEALFRVIAVAAPILGAVVGLIIGWTRKRSVSGTVYGLMAGLVGTLVYGLWHLHLAIGSRYGFTNARILAIEVVLFLAMGVAAGFVYQKMTSRSRRCGDRYERLEARVEEPRSSNI